MDEEGIMEYVYNNNGQIHHSCGSSLPEGAIKVTGWKGTPGEPWEWYKNGSRISDDDLVATGLRKDYRGKYYDKDKLEHKISVLDKEPESTWTKDIWSHHTDVLNQETMTWIEDTDAKAEYEEAILRGKRTTEFSLFDKYQLPLLWADLTEAQQTEYTEWRTSWLNAPETKIQPERPEWFQA